MEGKGFDRLPTILRESMCVHAEAPNFTHVCWGEGRPHQIDYCGGPPLATTIYTSWRVRLLTYRMYMGRVQSPYYPTETGTRWIRTIA